MNKNNVLTGDCRELLKTLPEKHFDCCITSPPYYGLRDYGVENQIGLESTADEYINQLVCVFREVKRVLKDDGTLWVNIGDSYAGNCSRTSTGRAGMGKKREGIYARKDAKPKDLIGIPWMLAFALRADGWYLRQDIIWAKPNPMPESVKDRCTKSHEYIFLLSKSQKYYFDYEAIQEDAIWKDDKRKDDGRIAYEGKRTDNNTSMGQQSFVKISDKRNKRDVWFVSPKPVREAHFATYPEELIEPCILAGSRAGGVVLDPFFGSGTTGRAAARLGREYVGIELNEDYIKISDKRTNNVQIQLL